MPKLDSVQRAKEFLVAQIAGEAHRQGLPLSEVERKMLYFSETGWTLPDVLDVADQFSRDYNQNEYEEKIAALVQSADKRLRRESPGDYETWRNAIETLRNEDHYLLVMMHDVRVRPPGDELKLFVTALGIVLVLLAGAWISTK
jgi:hypothetical protein